MKQREKLDLILKRLYELRNDVHTHTLEDITKELDIFESKEDVQRLADRLEGDNYIKVSGSREGLAVKIKSHGIEYSEEDSYSRPGEPVLSLAFHFHPSSAGADSHALTQTAKENIILRYFYERRHKNEPDIMLRPLMEQLGIYESDDEVDSVAKIFYDEGLLVITPFEEGNARVFGIAPKGVKHYEAVANKAQGMSSSPIININGDVNAANASFGNNNSNWYQPYTASTKEAEDLIKAVREELQQSAELDDEKKEMLVDYVDDIGESVKTKRPVRQYKWSALFENTSKLVDIFSKVQKLWHLVEGNSQTPAI